MRLSGAIGAGGRLGQGLNDATLGPMIERAFRAGKPAAVAVVINSPGGSPVQSSLIAARLRRLADEKKLPLHAFVEDAAASGGYWLASAADDIWVDPASIVGSIGVIAASFGLSDLLARQGIERRVHTAGRSKSFADPFLPEKPEDVARLRAILEPLHQTFIAQITARRGVRLAQDVALFEGDVWVGQQAVDVGLADGIAHPVPKLRALYGDKVRIMPMTPRRPFLGRFGIGLGAISGYGRAADGPLGTEAAAFADALIAVAEQRALWGRYGL